MSEPTEGGQAPTDVLAPEGPAMPDAVWRWLKQSSPEVPQDVIDTTAAVNAVISRWGKAYGWRPDPGKPWPQDKVRGAVMLAGRLYRRRDSPAGVEVYGSDGATYVARTDPDVAMLLEIGPYASPMGVG